MGMSDEILEPLNTSTLLPKLEYPHRNVVVKFNGSCLVKNDKFTFDKKVFMHCL